MQYLSRHGLKLYYNPKVYSPEYSSQDPIDLVDKLIRDGGRPDISVLDVGCGAGVLGLGLKHLQPNIDLLMTDISRESVRITKLNAKRLGMDDVVVRQQDVLNDTGAFMWDIIVANLPTFSAKQMTSLPLHGPKSAYDGGTDGLYLYRKLFKEAKDRCKALVCECQEAHQGTFLKLAKSEGWQLILSTKSAFAFLPPKK